MCGIVVAHSLHDVYGMMDALQGRGRISAGIAAVGEGHIDILKWLGLVKDFSLKDLYKIFPSHRYYAFLGQVRYATSGKDTDRILMEAHPHTIGGILTDNKSHIIIKNASAAIVCNGQSEDKYFSEINKGRLLTGCDTEKLLHFHRKKSEYEIMANIPGAFTLAIADAKHREIIVMRDRTGIKPGVLGQKDGKYCVVSENIALRKNGARYIEDLSPGCIYYLSENGEYRKIKTDVDIFFRHCFFEWNYFAHVDSVLNEMSVMTLRKKLGLVLSEEHALPHLDYISFVPRCPESAARVYANVLSIPFIYAFYKMRDERAFQGLTRTDCAGSILKNLYLNPNENENLFKKDIGIIDDSIVRGNNIKYTARLLYEFAKIRSACIMSYTPPIGIIGEDGEPRGCKFGIDMPPNDNFIARGKTIQEISAEIGMETRYISVEGMLRGFEKLGMPREHLCTYCIGGEHPFKGL